MMGRMVEIADDRRHIALKRGFLIVHDTVSEHKTELGKVPIDDIAAVIANAHGISYTNNLLVALAERGIPFVLCGANHNAIGMLLPIEGHHLQAKRIEAQIAAKQPTHKRLWAEIIKAKLTQQAAVLEATGAVAAPLTALVKKVKSGDSNNIEAQGARRYWGALFGNTFRRNQNGDGLNALLNYGYTIMRSATARAVIAAGLHPSIGLHHSNDANPMRLVDDLIEPFRPLIDLKVWQLQKHGEEAITPYTKRILVNTLYDDMHSNAGITPVMACMHKLASTLAQVYLGERRTLELPLPNLPLHFNSSLD